MLVGPGEEPASQPKENRARINIKSTLFDGIIVYMDLIVELLNSMVLQPRVDHEHFSPPPEGRFPNLINLIFWKMALFNTRKMRVPGAHVGQCFFWEGYPPSDVI